MIKKICGIVLAVFLVSSCTSEKSGSSRHYNKQARHSVPMKYNKEVFNKFADGTDAISESNIESKVFYFNFDDSKIKNNSQHDLAQVANYLLEHPDVTAKVNGHTDERGSREYNIGLGERRAQSVSEILMSHGVKRDQLAVISYGKERPAAQGHDEDTWQKNRRAELKFMVG